LRRRRFLAPGVDSDATRRRHRDCGIGRHAAVRTALGRPASTRPATRRGPPQLRDLHRPLAPASQPPRTLVSHGIVDARGARVSSRDRFTATSTSCTFDALTVATSSVAEAAEPGGDCGALVARAVDRGGCHLNCVLHHGSRPRRNALRSARTTG
jgi:hypothetical protein